MVTPYICGAYIYFGLAWASGAGEMQLKVSRYANESNPTSNYLPLYAFLKTATCDENCPKRRSALLPILSKLSKFGSLTQIHIIHCFS